MNLSFDFSMTSVGRLIVLFILLCSGSVSRGKEEASSGASGVKTKVKTILLDPIDVKRERIVPLKIYLIPSTEAKPVIVFSHGLGGSREGNPYLGNHWAKNGYVVVFVQHAGSDRTVWESVPPAERMSALKNAAGVQATIDRLNDVPFVLDQLEKWNADESHDLFSKLDLDHVGMCGHSFGAVTTMGLAGRKYPGDRSMPEKRFDAFLPMSPQPGKGLSPEKSFGHLLMPILCMTGTNDGSPIDSSLNPEARQEVYAAFPDGDKFQLVLEGANHFAFGEGGAMKSKQRNPNHHPVILELSTRFWDAYLKGDAGARAWLQSEAPRKIESMAKEDAWEWK